MALFVGGRYSGSTILLHHSYNIVYLHLLVNTVRFRFESLYCFLRTSANSLT